MKKKYKIELAIAVILTLAELISVFLSLAIYQYIPVAYIIIFMNVDILYAVFLLILNSNYRKRY